MNSRHMVVSMGMLPPMPKPTKAVSTRMALYVEGAPKQSPKTEATRTVRLKLYCRPEGLHQERSACYVGCSGKARGPTNDVNKHTPCECLN